MLTMVEKLEKASVLLIFLAFVQSEVLIMKVNVGDRVEMKTAPVRLLQEFEILRIGNGF